jgi:hypothetical protein
LTSSAVRILVQQIDAEQAKLEAAANQMVVEKTPKKIKVPASAPRHPGTHSALRYKQHATYSTAYTSTAQDAACSAAHAEQFIAVFAACSLQRRTWSA